MLFHQFDNPYPSGEGSRVQTWVSAEDYKFVQRIRVEKGTITTTINILFDKLVRELRARGITDYTDVKDFENFVVNSKLTL